MDYEVSPASLEDMEKEPRGRGDTICQVLREIYHLTDDKGIKYRCRISVTMAKRMAGKLKAYKEGKVG
jgi:hypothetical protein